MVERDHLSNCSARNYTPIKKENLLSRGNYWVYPTNLTYCRAYGTQPIFFLEERLCGLIIFGMKQKI